MDDVAHAMGEMKDAAASAVPVLIELLRDPSPKRVAAAAYVLGQIGPAARDALPGLQEVWKKTRNAEVREVVQRAIFALGDVPQG
jgi:HEAT repeat protein